MINGKNKGHKLQLKDNIQIRIKKLKSNSSPTFPFFSTRMGILQFNASATLTASFIHNTKPHRFPVPPNQLGLTRGRVVGAAAAAETTASGSGGPEANAPEEPPSIDFAFVSSRLMPDGTPDIQLRSACGGQKLRDIMLDTHVDLYGPYAAPLSNCAGGGTCGTCIVEVVEGKELLSPRTEKEKEKLKRQPKTWRLACQTTVGKEDSRGQVVIQQLPEWKAHKWE